MVRARCGAACRRESAHPRRARDRRRARKEHRRRLSRGGGPGRPACAATRTDRGDGTEGGAAMSVLSRYFERVGDRPDPAPTALYAMLDHIASVSPSVAAAIVHELGDQRTNLKLIASENYCSLATQFAQGTLFTDKYAEGYPAHRFYAGCDNVDDVESEAARLAIQIFGAEHAYVQPHSGADANLLAYLAILTTRVETKMLAQLGIEDPSKVSRTDWTRIREATHSQRLLGLDYYSGGHLTHGYRHNYSSQLFDAYTYTVDRKTMLLDLDEIRRQAREIKPLVLLAGYSAYSRKIDFAKMREIADEVGAVLMVDMQVLTGGTDNHLLLLDVHKSFGLTGRQAESAIRECHMTLNRNALPFDENGPWYTSGLRVGTPAATTLGMTPSDMREVARVFKLVLSNTKSSIVQKGAE